MNRTLDSKCREYQKTADYHLDADKPIIVHIDGRIIIPQIVKMLKVERGNVIEFERRKWSIIDGMDLKIQENQIKLKNMIMVCE